MKNKIDVNKIFIKTDKKNARNRDKQMNSFVEQ